MKGSQFIFDGIDLLYYKCHKINLNRGGFLSERLRINKMQSV